MHKIGSIPASYAATTARSIKPVRGCGFAAATTMTSWFALATTTRSVVSVSSALRRSTEERSPKRTMRARVSFAPDISPTTSTKSPVTMGVRRNSRARAAIRVRSCGVPSATTTDHRPRSTVTTRPRIACLYRGRSLVRGREPFLLGRTRTSDSSHSSKDRFRDGFTSALLSIAKAFFAKAL